MGEALETENLMSAKDSKKDQEKQMPRRWEVPCFLRNTVLVMGTKQRGRRLEQSQTVEGPQGQQCPWMGEGREQHRTQRRGPGVSALVPVLSGKFRVVI